MERSSEKSEQQSNGGSSDRLPILIFPGFMSSGLQVVESPTESAAHDPTNTAFGGAPKAKKGWRGQQVWLDIKTAGFESLYFGSALQANEILREHGENYNEELHKRYKQESECKSRWIQHLKLAEDMHSDIDGIKVRPMEGLDAVNCLMPGSGTLAKALSWVFFSVTEVLTKHGYENGVDLDAAPYDWRVPPCVLEERDGFFTKTMKKVETLYQRNGNTPIVLLCHSMGCKACHYFLNFALKHPEGGRDWLDKHIHTYFPVGAPHLGAPKSMRGAILGDRMGLESFLSAEEALILSRTWGSIPWLFPGQLPSTNAPALSLMRREGVIHVSIGSFDVESLYRGADRPPKLRLCVTFAGKTLRSQFQTPDGGSYIMKFDDTFTFAAPPDLPHNAEKQHLKVHLEESLLWKIRKKTLWSQVKENVDEYIRCCRYAPCVAVRESVSGLVGLSASAVDTLATLVGSTKKLAESNEKNMSESVSVSTSVEFKMQLDLVDAERIKTMRRLRITTPSTEITVRVQFAPPQHDVNTDSLVNFHVGRLSDTSPRLEVEDPKHKEIVYQRINGIQLLRSELLLPIRDVMLGCYEPDPMGPRTLSAEEAPPVKKVKAVYGVNLPTEVGAVYRRRNIVQKKGKVQNVNKVDAEARLIPFPGYKLDKGYILESPGTPQKVADGSGDTVYRSGDGTVPYWSLQHSRSWQDKCDVEVHEIDKAEHREILADSRFHKILIDYVTK